MNSSRRAQQGDISVYIALMVLSIILSSTLLFSAILSRQFRATEDAVASERAYFSANSGLEEGLYQLSLFASEEPITLQGVLDYPTENAAAAFSGTAQYAADGSTPCVQVSGGYPVLANQTYPDDTPAAQNRRLQTGPSDCFP